MMIELFGCLVIEWVKERIHESADPQQSSENASRITMNDFRVWMLTPSRSCSAEHRCFCSFHSLINPDRLEECAAIE